MVWVRTGDAANHTDSGCVSYMYMRERRTKQIPEERRRERDWRSGNWQTIDFSKCKRLQSFDEHRPLHLPLIILMPWAQLLYYTGRLDCTKLDVGKDEISVKINRLLVVLCRIGELV